jgi:hypothetical protein
MLWLIIGTGNENLGIPQRSSNELLLRQVEKPRLREFRPEMMEDHGTGDAGEAAEVKSKRPAFEASPARLGLADT